MTHDGDFQDLVVEISGVTLVPEPNGVLIAGLVSLMCFCFAGHSGKSKGLGDN